MESQPLEGQVIRSASAAPAAELASFLLTDLGAHVVHAAPGERAEIGPAGSEPSSVRLSPFGERGRFADVPDHHSAAEAIGGAQMAQYTYTPGPAYLVSPYATVAQALLCVAATLAGRISRSSAPVSVSALQGLLALNAGFYVFGPEPEPGRFAHSPRGQTPVYSTYRAADDWLFIGASTTPFMIKVLRAVGLEDALDDPRLHGGAAALREPGLARELWERIDPIVRQRPRQEWLALFEEIKVPAGPVLTMEEALAHPQIRAAGLAEDGAPIGRLTRLSSVTRRGDGTPRTPRTPGPLAMSGLRVVELAGYIAGSYIGRLLSDLGADVVKIEPPDGDPFRTNGYGFVAWNHGKKSLALNLRNEADRARLLALVSEADILLTNYRPEALDRMGVGRETLFARNPGLIHCTVSAFGESGPLAHLPGFDPVVQAFTGIMKRQGGDGDPVKPQMAATDYLSAMLATTGVLAARLAQLARGGGYVVRTSLLAAALLLNHEAYEAVREGRRPLIGGRDFKGPHALNGLHRAADGWLLTVAPDVRPEALKPEAWEYVQKGIGADDVEVAIERLQGLGVPAVPCVDPWDLPAEPHAFENDLWMKIDQPGLGSLTLPAPVLGPAGGSRPAPACGEQNGRAEIWDAP